MITAHDHLWVADGVTNRMVKYDLNGKYLFSWGVYGTFPGAFWAVHQFSADTDGNLYTAEVLGGRQQKFGPKKGADPAQLVGSGAAEDGYGQPALGSAAVFRQERQESRVGPQ